MLRSPSFLGPLLFPHAIYLINILPSFSLKNFFLHFLLYKKLPDYNTLHIFGFEFGPLPRHIININSLIHHYHVPFSTLLQITKDFCVITFQWTAPTFPKTFNSMNQNFLSAISLRAKSLTTFTHVLLPSLNPTITNSFSQSILNPHTPIFCLIVPLLPCPFLLLSPLHHHPCRALHPWLLIPFLTQ